MLFCSVSLLAVSLQKIRYSASQRLHVTDNWRLTIGRLSTDYRLIQKIILLSYLSY